MNTLSGRRPLLIAALLALAVLPGPAAVPSAFAATGAIPGTTSATPLPASLAWGWPLAGTPAVVHTFDPPEKPWLSGHRGVDLTAPQGAAVLAPVDGVVTFSGIVVNRAVLTIAVKDGLRLSFEPVASPLKAGDAVVRGQVVGTVEGPTHCDGSAAGSCLHWGVRRGDTYLNPLQFILDLRPSVLQPLMNNKKKAAAATSAKDPWRQLKPGTARQGTTPIKPAWRAMPLDCRSSCHRPNA